MIKTVIWTEDKIVEKLTLLSSEERNKTLLLKRHPQYPTYFSIDSFQPDYIYRLGELIGPYRVVSMFMVDELRKLASNENYNLIVFIDDPSYLLERVDHLNDPYPGELNVTLHKFQIQGFNYTKDLPADILNWSTGTGKSVLAVSKAKYLLETGKVDKIVVASKNHNKINWQRQFKNIGGLNAHIAEASGSNATIKRAGRIKIYNESQIFILNYEKFRYRDDSNQGNKSSPGDGQEIENALKKKRVYFIYDEMPMYLKNPNTLIYKGVKKIIRSTKEARQTMLSATPIDNIPEDVYWCMKLLSPKTLGTVKEFRVDYAKTFNRFAKWKVKAWDKEKLQELGMRLSHITHKVDKYRDPEIMAQFPQEHWEDIIIDWSAQDRKLYDWATAEIKARADHLGFDNHTLQLICNNPLFLSYAHGELSQEMTQQFKLTDRHSAKLDTLKILLGQLDGKVVIFSIYNDLGAKPLAKYLDEWKCSYVLFDGSDRQKQNALDQFRENKRIKIFLSSDQGSDSINLPEATSVINYDLPWKFTTLTQRVNRVNRIDSEHKHVFYYNLIMAASMEERKLKIISQKQGYDYAVFGTDIADQADILSGLDRETLWYILTGE